MLAKKIKNEALARRFGGQSVCYGVKNCLFHVCLVSVSNVVIGFPVTVSCMSSSGLEALSCPFSTKFIKCTELRFTTSPAIAYTQCCAFALYFQSVWSIFKGRIFSVGKAHSLASFGQALAGATCKSVCLWVGLTRTAT